MEMARMRGFFVRPRRLLTMTPQNGLRCLVLVLACAGSAILVPLDAQEKPDLPKALATLKGHGELVYTVAFSPDGKHLVTGSFDNTIKLWEANGKELKTFAGPNGHQKMVLSVAFSGDGQMLASGAADNTVKVWDVPTSSPLRTITAKDVAGAIALSVDGTKLATAGKDGVVKIYNAADAKELFTMSGHTGPVTGVAFSTNGQVLATCGADKTLRYWNATNGQTIALVGAHTAQVNAVGIHPKDNQAYTVADDGTLKFWQMPPIPGRTLPAHGGPILALALSSDGTQVLTAGADKRSEE